MSRGAKVRVTDIKPRAELQDFVERLANGVELHLGEHREEEFLASDFIVLSPGVPTSIPQLRQASAAGVEILSEVELAYRFLTGTFVGVTGSNGKTTTTALIGQILRTAGMETVVAGNIGAPLSQFIDTPLDKSGKTTFVVELSSFQLETSSRLRCKIAALLNITPDHLDRYEDFEAYRLAKRRIFMNQGSDDYAVVNADDPTALTTAEGLPAKLFPFTRLKEPNEGAFVREGRIVVRWSGEELDLISTTDFRLRGSHNLENVLAAASAAFLLGVGPEGIAEAVRSFPGVEHRLESVGCLEGVEYYNDSKATNVDSAIKAIQAFETPLLLIMGGLDKGTDFRPLRNVVSHQAKQLILIGKASAKLSSVLSDTVPTVTAADLAEAVDIAHRSAVPGDTVLLVPACASFDMFEDYEERGRVFKKLVARLQGADGTKLERATK
jgi:UDP-N-acetylmuramoylalanine--D-glutamate ligase